MSYTFRDDNPILGSGAQIEINNGASAPTLVNLQLVEVVGIFGVTPTTSTQQTVFIAPPAPSLTGSLIPLGVYQVVAVTAFYDVASVSGVVDIVKIASTAADSTGTSMLASTIATSTSARTQVNGALATSTSTLKLAPGDRVVIKHTGTQTNLVDLTVCIYIARVG